MAFFTPANGPKLHVDDTGGKGLPVVFQHGLCGDAKQTAEVFPESTALRRITVECRGHGQSYAGDFKQFSIARFADDIAEVIESKGIGPVVIGGISMGAAIAMRLAATRPELIRGLIIARPAWSVKTAPANMRPNEEVGALLQELPGGVALQRFDQGDTAKHLLRVAPDNLTSLRGFFFRDNIETTAALLTGISADGTGLNWKNLRGITVPTLVIGSARDYIHPLMMAHELADVLPNARLVEVTPKGDDKPRYVEEFQAALKHFLEGFIE